MFKKIADKLGILDIIAPWSSENGSAENNINATQYREAPASPPAPTPQELRDEALARKLQAEEDRKFELLKAQLEAEELAEKNGKYAKRQRVSYHHKMTGTHYDAIIVGVHLDDGPDKPYYVSDFGVILYMIRINVANISEMPVCKSHCRPSNIQRKIYS